MFLKNVLVRASLDRNLSVLGESRGDFNTVRDPQLYVKAFCKRK